MPRPIKAIIDLSALDHNRQVLQQRAPNARFWAVIKANAYGHGIARTFPILCKTDGLAVLDLAEAQIVRELGWRGPVLLLEGVFDARDLEVCSQLNLTHTLHDLEQVKMLAGHKTKSPHDVYLKLNSGMNRLGFSPDIYRAIWAKLNAMPQVNHITLMTHFACADDEKGIAEPLKCFVKTTNGLPGQRSVANSAAVLSHMPDQTGQTNPVGEFALQCELLEVNSDWIRPGIAFYGASPDYPKHSAQDWGLKPVMSLRSQIISIQVLQVGDAVGYGAALVANKSMRIATVAVGYADGYMRVCGNKTPVLVGGIRTFVLGRVSMDMIAIDVTDLSWADVGTEVTLWGVSSCGVILSVDEVAHCAKTNCYELLTALAGRVPVVVVE